ncbi:MAG: DUF1624 domain-containing protein [Ruminococcaceae bacterium]|nr:DUF1624 domain-containing protein [Oscillospiraceae bacterium]
MKKRFYYIDFLRIFSMLSVIFLHVVADLLRVKYNSIEWHFSNIITAVIGIAVPVFFMISGAMLLSNEKSSSVDNLVKGRLVKVFIPFAFWSLIAILHYFVIDTVRTGSFGYDGMIYRFKYILSQPATIHLWFMYALIPIYLLLPFLKTLVDKMDKKQAIYLISLWMVCSVLYTTVQNLFPIKYKTVLTFNNSFNLNFIGGYIGFFILGYYLHVKDIKIKSRLLILIAIIDVAIISLGTYFATSYYNGYFEGFKVYTGVFTTVLSICVFLLFKNLYANIEKFSFCNVTEALSTFSFPIYLVHNLIIDFFNVLGFIQPENGIIYIIARFLAVFTASYIVIYILSKIKPLCFVSTGIKYRGFKNEKN